MTVHETTFVRTLMRLLSLIYLKCIGWQVEGDRPDIPKYVMIAAPHTSNWDFVIALAMAFVYRINIQIMMKSTWFFWPLGPVFCWLGAIPIDRSRKNNRVAQSIEAFKQKNEMLLMVPPSGTRKRVLYWKTGFYHIASGAGVPIVMGFLDYRRKRGGMGPVFYPTGDMEKDMQAIHAFYRDISGKYPSQSISTPVSAKAV